MFYEALSWFKIVKLADDLIRYSSQLAASILKRILQKFTWLNHESEIQVVDQFCQIFMCAFCKYIKIDFYLNKNKESEI